MMPIPWSSVSPDSVLTTNPCRSFMSPIRRISGIKVETASLIVVQGEPNIALFEDNILISDCRNSLIKLKLYWSVGDLFEVSINYWDGLATTFISHCAILSGLVGVPIILAKFNQNSRWMMDESDQQTAIAIWTRLVHLGTLYLTKTSNPSLLFQHDKHGATRSFRANSKKWRASETYLSYPEHADSEKALHISTTVRDPPPFRVTS